MWNCSTATQSRRGSNCMLRLHSPRRVVSCCVYGSRTLGMPPSDRRLSTRDATFSSKRCGEVPARSSMGSGPTGERSPTHQGLDLRRSQCPHAKQTTDSNPIRSRADKGSHRQRGGTTGTHRVRTHQPRLPLPRSSPRGLTLSRT